MDQSKKIVMETGMKEILKHLASVQEELDKQFKHLAIAHQELEKLLQLSRDIMEDGNEKVYPIYAKVLNGSLQNVCGEKYVEVVEKKDDRNLDLRKRKGIKDEIKSSQHRRKRAATRTDTSSEDELESSGSDRSEKRYAYDNEIERDDGFYLSKNRKCKLCRSESHRETNCPNVNKRCTECHKWGHVGIDCSIRKRRLAIEIRNDQRTSRHHKFHYSKR